nr:MAG TPA: Baseplate J like protein [Caudoviricetes sp.]
MAAERPEFIVPDFLDGTTPENIQERMMNELPADIDDMPGGFPYDMTMPTALVASELVNFHLVRALMIAFPQYAWGEWLDKHGENIHVYRHGATYASGKVKITGLQGTEIPAGRVFSTVATSETAAVEFKTVETARIGEEGYVMIPVRAVLQGAGSNVVADTVILQNKPLDGVTAVTNPDPITGGTEVENDESFYARIQLENESESFSYIGNDNDYKRWALSVDGVGDCIVMQAWDGPGTVKLVLVDSNGDPASEELTRAVYNHIVSPSNRSNRLLPTGTAKLTVAAATTVEISYQCTGLDYDSSVTNLEQIKQDFKKAVDSVYERAKKKGKFVYHQAESLITDLPGVNNYVAFKVNGTETDILLSEEEYPKTRGLDFS